MKGTFLPAGQVVRDRFDWGEAGWTSRPENTQAKQLAVLDVTILPGRGHDFHRHPDQEEVIYVIEGQIEQWIDHEKKLLGPGDAAFIDKGVVHASFQQGDEPAHILAILGPSVGEGGYAADDVSAEEEWKKLR